jgi:hypothetical protein
VTGAIAWHLAIEKDDRTMKSGTFSLVLVGMLLVAPAVLAIDAAQFREQGRIESIDKASLTLVVGDSSYPLTPSSRIYSHTGKPLSFNALQKGSTIKFNLAMPKGSQQPVIREILVLPAK